MFKFFGKNLKEIIKKNLIVFNKKDKFKEVNRQFKNKEQEIEKASITVTKIIDDMCSGYIVEANSVNNSIKIPQLRKGDFVLVSPKKLSNNQSLQYIHVEDGNLFVGCSGTFQIIVIPTREEEKNYPMLENLTLD